MGIRRGAMESQTIRISKKTHQTLRQLADEAGTSMTAILDEAVSEYQRKKYWEEYNAGYAALRADPEKWADYQKEIEAWDVTLTDGLEGY
jgi:predicted transcriptional regulator